LRVGEPLYDKYYGHASRLDRMQGALVAQFITVPIWAKYFPDKPMPVEEIT
jgi:hypothetical protein